MPKRYEIVLGFVLASAFWALILVLQSDPSSLHQICESNQSGIKECVPHYIIFVILWHTNKLLNDIAPALTAVATAFIAAFTYTLWDANRIAIEHTQTIERAYVKMSHPPPGLMFNSSGCDVRITIKNDGVTPARITNAFVNLKIFNADERLPTPPLYEVPEREPVRAFLVKEDIINFTETFSITLEEFQAAPPNSILCVFGYVDYVDVFNVRHRGGYGRRYLPNATSNNLGFVSQAGYNYDRVRAPGEGNDWT